MLGYAAPLKGKINDVIKAFGSTPFLSGVSTLSLPGCHVRLQREPRHVATWTGFEFWRQKLTPLAESQFDLGCHWLSGGPISGTAW